MTVAYEGNMMAYHGRCKFYCRKVRSCLTALLQNQDESCLDWLSKCKRNVNEVKVCQKNVNLVRVYIKEM